MRLTLLLIFGLFLAPMARSQPLENQIFFNLSYYGVLVGHPGLKFSIQYPITNFNAEAAAKNLNQVIMAGSVVVYFHRRNQIGVGVLGEMGFRNRSIRSINKEIFLGAGYLQTFLPNPVFDFDQPENQPRKQGYGQSQLVKFLGVGIGNNFEPDFNADYWMLRPTLLQISPINNGSTLNFALDAGYFFQP